MFKTSRFENPLPIAGLLILCTLSLACIEKANAATGPAAITLTAPTLNDDSTPLAASEIARFNIQCTFTPTGSTTGVPCQLSQAFITASGQTLTLTYPSTGGSAAFQGQTQRTDGRVSTWTPITTQATKVYAAIPPSNPGTPANLRVAKISIVIDYAPVYRVGSNGASIGTTIFGFVPYARSCDEERQGKVATWRGYDWYRVKIRNPERELWGTADPENLAAPCIGDNS